MVFIKKLTASSSATLSFVDGSRWCGARIILIRNIYLHLKIFIQQVLLNFTFNGQMMVASYDATKTTTVFTAYHRRMMAVLLNLI